MLALPVLWYLSNGDLQFPCSLCVRQASVSRLKRRIPSQCRSTGRESYRRESHRLNPPGAGSNEGIDVLAIKTHVVVFLFSRQIQPRPPLAITYHSNIGRRSLLRLEIHCISPATFWTFLCSAWKLPKSIRVSLARTARIRWGEVQDWDLGCVDLVDSVRSTK